MAPFLTIDTYNSEQLNSLRTLSSRAIQAFAPVTFLHRHYPSYVEDNDHILRFVDTMHETKDAKYFDRKRYSFSDHETDLIRDVCCRVSALTERLFDRQTLPIMSPLAHVMPYRVIHNIEKTLGRKLRIFEIGPGSGYLGAYLMLTGHSYSSMDNSTGFYLWQNRFFSTIAAETFVELASDQSTLHTEGPQSFHCPWWEFVAEESNTSIEADLIICDHALGEIHPLGLDFILRKCLTLMNSSREKLFLFTSPGGTDFNSVDEIHNAFLDAGYRRCASRAALYYGPGSILTSWSTDSAHVAPNTSLYRRLKTICGLTNKSDKTRATNLDNLSIYKPAWADNDRSRLTYSATEILSDLEGAAAQDYLFLKSAGKIVPDLPQIKLLG